MQDAQVKKSLLLLCKPWSNPSFFLCTVHTCDVEDSGSVRSPSPVIVMVGPPPGDFVVVLTSFPSRENMEVFGAIPVFFCFSV